MCNLIDIKDYKIYLFIRYRGIKEYYFGSVFCFFKSGGKE